MIGKALLLLVVVGLLANAARKWIGPKAVPPKARTPAVETARKCSECGSYLIGPGPCPDPECPSRSRG